MIEPGNNAPASFFRGANVPTSDSAEVIGEVSALTDIAMGLDSRHPDTKTLL